MGIKQTISYYIALLTVNDSIISRINLEEARKEKLESSYKIRLSDAELEKLDQLKPEERKIELKRLKQLQEEQRIELEERVKQLKQQEQEIPNYIPACQRIFEGIYQNTYQHNYDKINNVFDHPENLSGLDHLILPSENWFRYVFSSCRDCPGFEKMPIRPFETPERFEINCQRQVKGYIGTGTKAEWKEFKRKVKEYLNENTH